MGLCPWLGKRLQSRVKRALEAGVSWGRAALATASMSQCLHIPALTYGAWSRTRCPVSGADAWALKRTA